MRAALDDVEAAAAVAPRVFAVGRRLRAAVRDEDVVEDELPRARFWRTGASTVTGGRLLADGVAGVCATARPAVLIDATADANTTIEALRNK